MSIKLLFVINAPEFFLSHRLPVAVRARELGYEVHVLTGPGAGSSEIQSFGFSHYTVPMSRSGMSPFAELKTLFSIYRVIRRVHPTLVHLVTIKAVLYGGLASRLAGVPGVVAAISGLGTVFISPGIKARLLRAFVKQFYKVSLKQRHLRVIFQNPTDKALLSNLLSLNDIHTALIRGSGVSLDEYACKSETQGIPVVVMASRLLRDKGVFEFVEAARALRAKGVKAKFKLVGDPDPGNPTSVTEQELTRWSAEGHVSLLGYRTDIPALYAASHIVCLPSYYREGLPKTLVEAAACGRAVVTTDMPGCRDAIEPGETGLLVPPRDAMALADAIQYLIEHPQQRRRMGEAGRKLAERDFAIEKIVDAHMEIYRELLDK